LGILLNEKNNEKDKKKVIKGGKGKKRGKKSENINTKMLIGQEKMKTEKCFFSKS
jgi:hypothetical protein